MADIVARLSSADPEDSRGAAAPGREQLRARPGKLAYRRRLPHLQRPGNPAFVTFNTFATLQLDAACRTAVLGHCLHDNGVKLHMHAAVVMPTHVHLLFTPLEDALGQSFSLVEILSGIKGASAHAVNALLDRSGPVWQEESFDHLLRSSESLAAKIQYIELNPVEAHLARTPREYAWLWVEEP